LDRYRRKLSGPILDRIDLHVAVPRLTPEELVSIGGGGEPSAVVRGRVEQARKIQQERWRDMGYQCNAELPERVLRHNLDMEDDVRIFLADAMKRVRLSGRGYSRILRVARTVADLEGVARIAVRHVAESLSYREEWAFGNYGLRSGWKR